MANRFFRAPRATNSYSAIYMKQAECSIGDGSETYKNTEPIVWSGAYTHIGIRPPEFYYPNGPYKVNGTNIESKTGCYAVGISNFTTQQSSNGLGGNLVSGYGEYTGNGCLIIFGRKGTRSGSNIPTNLGTFEELQNITFKFSAFASPGPYTQTASGIWASPYEVGYVCNECCDIQYMLVSGEFPTDISLNMKTGIATGNIPDMDSWMARWKQTETEKLSETNYGTKGSSSSFRNGLPANNTARFVVRAFNAKDPRVFTDKEFTFNTTNSWNSDRDKLLLNISRNFKTT